MGIRGLLSFIDPVSEIFKPSTSFNIVIDGKSLLYTILEEYDWRHGGEFKSLSDSIDNLCDYLKPYCKTITVLMDGLSGQAKIKTIKERRTQRIISLQSAFTQTELPKRQIRPVGSSAVFVQKFIKNGAIVHQLNEEADHALAFYASKQPNTYVLSHDSDSLIVPCAGVIHMKMNSNNKIYLKVFKQNKILDYLGLNNAKQLILFACFVGNDITRQIPKKLQKAISDKITHGHYFRKVCSIIRQNECQDLVKCINNCLDSLIDLSKEEKEPLLQAISHYQFQCSRTTDTIERSLETGWCSEELLRAVQTKNHTFPIIPSDLNKESPWKLSRPLRKILYAVLGIDQVEETILLGVDDNDFDTHTITVDEQYVDKKHSILTVLSAAERTEHTELPLWWELASHEEKAIELTLRAIEAHGGYSLHSSEARSIRWAFKSVGSGGKTTPKVESCTIYSTFLVFWVHLQTLHHLTMANISWPPLPNGSDVSKALSQTLLESFFS